MDQIATTERLAGKTIPNWSFDVTRGVYVRNDTGEVLTPEELRDAMDQVVEGAKRESHDLLLLLLAGSLTVALWEGKMRTLIAALHTAASAAASGGVPGIARDLETDLRAVIAREYAHLAGFVSVLNVAFVVSQNIGVYQEQWLARAGSYMDSGLMTFERHRWMLMVFLDYTEARRILHPEAEHCLGCEGQAGRGWVAIEDFAPLGNEECGQWCKCSVEYRKTTPRLA